jgi:hypothetical protein
MNKFTILLPLIFLSGCGNDVRDCSDSKVKDELMEIINANAYSREEIRSAIDAEILNIKMLSHQEDVKTNVCGADFSVSYQDEKGQDKTHKTDFVYKLSFLEDKNDTEVEADLSNIKKLLVGVSWDRGCWFNNGGMKTPKQCKE